jgi:formylglycine-generating enzyme required for sulfatase activity
MASAPDQPPDPLASAWATAVGRDSHGVFATFTAHGGSQRMRFIPPGRFTMGSPPSEAGRFDAEGPQHEVTLTEGYWLADTPCTQALWQAVMGTNPSRCRSPQRPVEQVSWDDVQQLLAKLDAAVPGLRPRLPTEAEWEHACRAGTTTATYAGDLDLRAENDAPVLDAIAWYGGNSGTHEVGNKHPNPWGLYDMLGNVSEWCEDVYASYQAHAVENPLAVEGRFELARVIRGGAWYAGARYVRAAYRYWRDPDHCDDGLGVRLCVGGTSLLGR